MEGWSQAAPREGCGLGLSDGGHCGPVGPRDQEDTPSHWLPLEPLSPAPCLYPGDSYCLPLLMPLGLETMPSAQIAVL